MDFRRFLQLTVCPAFYIIGRMQGKPVEVLFWYNSDNLCQTKFSYIGSNTRDSHKRIPDYKHSIENILIINLIK
jgi:hypothetical protein